MSIILDALKKKYEAEIENHYIMIDLLYEFLYKCSSLWK